MCTLFALLRLAACALRGRGCKLWLSVALQNITSRCRLLSSLFAEHIFSTCSSFAVAPAFRAPPPSSAPLCSLRSLPCFFLQQCAGSAAALAYLDLQSSPRISTPTQAHFLGAHAAPPALAAPQTTSPQLRPRTGYSCLYCPAMAQPVLLQYRSPCVVISCPLCFHCCCLFPCSRRTPARLQVYLPVGLLRCS